MGADPRRQVRAATLVDMSTGIGLEIAPLDNPIASKDHSDVHYVDIVDTAALRRKYGDDPNVGTDEIAEVDFALQDPDGRIRSLPETLRKDALYDWVVASHVIEHTPDLIGWLAEVAEVMVDDGLFLLMIPDRRYTFDVLRPQTTVGQILQAHTAADTVPSERAVYDHIRSFVSVTAPDLWASSAARDYPRQFTLEEAAELRRRVLETGEYSDSHVWMFTPTVFVEQIVDLCQLGLCDFTIERIVPTAFNELEFSAVLRRLPRGLGGEELATARARGMQSFAEEPTGTTLTSGPDNEDRPVPGGKSEGSYPAHTVPAIALSDRELSLIHWKRRIIGRVRSGRRHS